MSLQTGDRSREIIFVYDLPYTERRSLCNILDINDQWERLGGEKMGFSVIELSEMKRAEKCGESPSDRLLQIWGQRNNTVLNLYLLLYEMEHYQAMSVLQPFITEEYHLDKLKDPIYMKQGKEVRKPPANLFYPQRGAQSTLKVLSARNMDNYERPNKDVAKLTEPSDKLHHHLVRSIQKSGFASEQTTPSSNNVVKKEKDSKIINTELSAHFTHPPKQNADLPNVSKSQNESSLLEDKLLADDSGKRHHTSTSCLSTLSECRVPMISYQELDDATLNWSKQHLLGSGGFGSVYKGTWINVHVAIKRIHTPNSNAESSKPHSITQTLDELRYLLKFRHDNILQIYGFCAEEGKPLCLVYQFMPNGSLDYRLQCKKMGAFGDKVLRPLTWYERFFIAKGTAAAIEFLHTVQEKPLIHGDIKSANILLDKNLEPKLGDFGLAREGPQSQYTSVQVSHVHGTRPYIPEEYLRSKTLSTKVDIYSYGIVLFEICTGCRAYNDKTRKYLKDEVLTSKDYGILKDMKSGPDCVNVFEILLNIGLECVNKNKRERPEMKTTFQKLNLFANALTKEEATFGSPSVSPIPLHPWQDTVGSSPSMFHPSRVPPSHIHQLTHLSVPPTHGFPPMSNPSRSPMPCMIPGITLPLAHGWAMNVPNPAGGNLYHYPQNIYKHTGVELDMDGNRNVILLHDTSLDSKTMKHEGMMPMPDLSRLMLHSDKDSEPSVDDFNDQSESERIENTSCSLASNQEVQATSSLLKNETDISLKLCVAADDEGFGEPSAVGKKSFLD